MEESNDLPPERHLLSNSSHGRRLIIRSVSLLPLPPLSLPQEQQQNLSSIRTKLTSTARFQSLTLSTWTITVSALFYFCYEHNSNFNRRETSNLTLILSDLPTILYHTSSWKSVGNEFAAVNPSSVTLRGLNYLTKRYKWMELILNFTEINYIKYVILYWEFLPNIKMIKSRTISWTGYVKYHKLIQNLSPETWIETPFLRSRRIW
jgi:hypothetical protein